MRSIVILILVTAFTFQLNAQKLAKHIYLDLNTPEIRSNLWRSNANLWRLWDGEKYLMVDPFGKVVLELSAFQSVSDFNQGYAVVETPSAKFGVINDEGLLVIDTIYDGLKNYQLGYFHVAKETGHYVKENRGEGLKPYPILSWRLLDHNLKAIPLAFSGITQINEMVTADLFSGERLSINLLKVNGGYYHPLMEAIEKVDGKQVKKVIDMKERKINYMNIETEELMLTISFNKKPVNRT